MAMARSVCGSCVCSTVDGVSVITKCARLSISSSIMLAHQASSRPGGGASAGVRALHKPASCFIFDGDRRYVPSVPSCGHGHGCCTLVHSPHRPTSSHIWHWAPAPAPAPDLTAVGPTLKNRYVPGAAVRRYLLPPPSGAQPGCVTAMFPAQSPTGTWEVFLSRSWPRQITALQGSCGYSGTNERGTSGPRTWVAPPTHR